MKKIIIITVLIFTVFCSYGQRREAFASATLTGDTTLSIILADNIIKCNVFATSTSTDSCIISGDDIFTIGGIPVAMDSIKVYAGISYTIGTGNYPIKNATIHNRDGCVTFLSVMRYSGRQ